MTKLGKRKKRARLLPRTPLSTVGTEGAGDISTWRIYEPKINKEKCTKCGICWLYCPEGAIKMNPNQPPEVDLSQCKGCGICARECPLKNIVMKFKGEEKVAAKNSRKW